MADYRTLGLSNPRIVEPSDYPYMILSISHTRCVYVTKMFVIH